ncbi:multiple sugar transport system permease protein [Streptosporangium canum]|uniref:Multiple sugar transport system permease protein n=1 Tax=Streptosporangium canum TaxID=324952 RepID=A0A1I3TIV7_9ACTN|nr:multiple sugar transport system permease protein [Streptosporangium canum]
MAGVLQRETPKAGAEAVGHARPRHPRRSRSHVAVFVAPFFVVFALFFLAPIGYAVYQSFFKLTSSGLGLTEPTLDFAGLDNYTAALTSPAFLGSIGRVLLFSLIEVPVMVVCALTLALLLDSARARFRAFFRVSFFLPYGVPGVIASLLWGFLYVPQTSPLVDALALVGLPHDFLGPGTILLAIANISTWQFAGYNMLVLIAGLQAIPQELYEAARVDGATEIRIAWHVKIPLVRAPLVLITVFTLIGTLQLFVEPLVLKPLTTAISSDYTPNLAAYNQAFAQSNIHLASAEATLIAIMSFVISFGFLRLVNRKGKRAW